jgi:hypothetical protein
MGIEIHRGMKDANDFDGAVNDGKEANMFTKPR